MSKRKEAEKSKKKRFEGEEESSSDEEDIVNVDFEFFAPQPDVDFHGLKMLMRQLFDADAQLFDLSAIADLILSQPTIGSTVKVDTNESDPYAFLTVLNLKVHRDKPHVQTLINYLVKQAGRNANLKSVGEVLNSVDSEVGLVITERLINMPAEIAPPMYKMLQEEIQWAVEDKEPYTFTHYLVISKTYNEIESKLDLEGDRPKKKQRNEGADNTLFYFHAEDVILQQHAVAFGDYPLVHQGAEGDADSKRTFQELGIKPQGHMILIEQSNFEKAFTALQTAFPG